MRRRCNRSPDPKAAVALARKANDALAEHIAKRPDRFQGLAAVAMQDPDRGDRKNWERAVTQLGFKGVLVNGFSQINDPDAAVYYDLLQYRPFWAAVERLGVPFYLHPRSPLARDARLYAGHPWMMGAAWAFGNETAVHALRLVGSGLFDEHPAACDCAWAPGRGTSRSVCGGSTIATPPPTRPTAIGRSGKIADYIRENFYVTTSGNFSTSALMQTIAELGSSTSCSRSTGPMRRSSTPQAGSRTCSISAKATG